jgi:phenylpropionate dioxygenase-like ring-hydroxylating dioxygenase large terminal subunit
MLLPNSALLIQKEHVEFINFRPLSAGETEITITTLIPKNTDLNDINQLRHWQKNHDITNTTLNEDWALGESIQSSLESGALPYIQYGKNEWALHAFNEELDALLSV